MNEYEGRYEYEPDDEWGDEEPIKEKPQARYSDRRHPRVERVGQQVLIKALKEAESDFQSLDSLWHVFIQHVREHEWAEEIARQIKSMQSEMAAAIKHDCEGDLRQRALIEITKEMRSEVASELKERYRKELAASIEAEVKQQLLLEFKTTLRPMVLREVRTEVEPIVRAEVRTQLLNDPKLKDEVVADIRRRIAGL